MRGESAVDYVHAAISSAAHWEAGMAAHHLPRQVRDKRRTIA